MHQWSLEELELKVELFKEGMNFSDDSFLVFGMYIEGANFNLNT
jgi:hypothetical protein